MDRVWSQSLRSQSWVDFGYWARSYYVYIYEYIYSKLIRIFLVIPQGGINEIWVDLYNVIVAELLNQAMADEPIGFIDEYAVLCGLWNGRVIVKVVLCH